jgi:WD40-like Beta Propeller Repeat
LRGYQILRVGLHPHHNRIVLVTTRFIYAHGSSRVYPVPLLDPAQDLRGFWLAGWRSDGLERLRSQHLALTGQPFARASDAVGLGPARRLEALRPAANRLNETNPAHWLWGSVRVQHLVWAPDGRSFLAAFETDPGHRQLWAVGLDGSAPKLVASGDIREYGWSPDGATIVFTLFDPAAAAPSPDRPFAIQVVPATRIGQQPIPIVTRLPTAQLPMSTSQIAPGDVTEAPQWTPDGKTVLVQTYPYQGRRIVAVDVPSGRPFDLSQPHWDAYFALSPDGTQLLLNNGRDNFWTAALIRRP